MNTPLSGVRLTVFKKKFRPFHYELQGNNKYMVENTMVNTLEQIVLCVDAEEWVQPI